MKIETSTVPAVKHTAVPWTIRKEIDGDIPITGANLSRVALCDGDYVGRNIENAVLIVRAVNSHALLVEALQDAILLAHPCSECGQVELLGKGLARCPCADRPWDVHSIGAVAEAYEPMIAALAAAKEVQS